ncbi:MAG: sigma-54-dependent Fis family transcriptional regulator [Calditrichaeota bacterium]|nr:sigma-54-dependent Fis family transcriptional regulator [Calditrichota bacterium]
MLNILLVDERVAALRKYFKIFSNLGTQCITVNKFDQIPLVLTQEHPDAIFSNDQFVDLEHIDLVKEIKGVAPSIPIILFSDNPNMDSVVRAMKAGVHDYLTPPLDQSKFKNALNIFPESKSPGKGLLNLLNHSKLAKNNFELANVVGKSRIMQNIAKLVYKVARSDANVFICGESGTGKELIANNIHKYSRRHKNAFIPLDCASLPHELIESEIFGYEKGAFTGAECQKPGLLELAHNGTFFLDEITELDIALQAKLLRVIQERKFRKIGGKDLINVDIRIVSATNRDPEKAVEEKIFRQDLYFRVNVIRIDLPPLRDRKEDIPFLVESFIEQFNLKASHVIEGITHDALHCLKQYDWPGNVRELCNVIERAIALTEGKWLTVNDLPENILDNHNYFDTSYQNLGFKEASEMLLRQFRKKYFKNLLEKYNGNISKIANEAKLSRGSIYRMLQESELKRFVVHKFRAEI